MAELPNANIAVLKARLNSIAGEINHVTTGVGGRTLDTKEVAKCIENFTQFITSVAEEYGSHPQYILGQHVCCNVLILVLDRLVKPVLTQYCATSARRVPSAAVLAGETITSADIQSDVKVRRVRQDVVRPFRSLLQALHYHLLMEPVADGGRASSDARAAEEPTTRSLSAGRRLRGSLTADGAGGGGDAEDTNGSDDKVAASTHAALLQEADLDMFYSASQTSVAPLLWKHGAPLVCVCNHFLEVLQSEILTPVVGSDYAVMLRELLHWAGYCRQLTNNFVGKLCERLLVLLERTAAAASSSGVADTADASAHAVVMVVPTVEEAVVYVSALAELCRLPQLSSSFAPQVAIETSITTFTQRLTSLVVRCHQHPSADLRLEACCVCALRRLAEGIQQDHPQTAREPVELVRHLSDFFFLPIATRRERWRFEVLEFISLQLCLSFAGVLGMEIPRDLGRGVVSHATTAAAAHNTEKSTWGREGGERAAMPALAPHAVRLLHDTILPLALTLFTQSRHSYSFLSRRELFHSPCAPITEVLTFGSIVFYLAAATNVGGAMANESIYHPQADTEAEARTVAAHRAEALDYGASGQPPAQSSSDSTLTRSPAALLLAALRSEFFVLATATGADSPDGVREHKLGAAAVNDTFSDAALFLLHLLTQPLTTLHFSAEECDMLVEHCLTPLFPCFGARLGPLLLASLRAVVPHCSVPAQQRTFAFIVRRFIPLPTALSEEERQPQEPVYAILAVLAQSGLLGRWPLLPSAREGSADAARDDAVQRIAGAAHSQFLCARVAAAISVRERRVQLSGPLTTHAALGPTSRMNAASDSSNALAGSRLTPSLLLAMLRFLSALEMAPLLLGSRAAADASVSAVLPSWMTTDVCTDRLAEREDRGLTFAFDGVASACTFFADNRSSTRPATHAAHEARYVMLAVAQNIEDYAAARAARWMLHVQADDSGGGRWRGRIGDASGPLRRYFRELQTRWHTRLDATRRTPAAHVPPVVARAAEGQWLLLPDPSNVARAETAAKGRMTSSSLPSSEDDEDVSTGARGVRRFDVPEGFAVLLAASAAAACMRLRRRAELAVLETSAVPAAKTPAVPPRVHPELESMTSDRAGASRRSSTTTTTVQSDEPVYANAVDEEALTAQHVVLCTQSVQLLHVLLRLHRARLWCFGQERSQPYQATTPASVQGDDEDECATDLHVLQSTPALFDDLPQVLSQLSPNGQMYYLVMWLCDFLTARLLRAPLVRYYPLLLTLQVCFEDVGALLMSPGFACAEPRQTIARFLGVLTRRLLEDGIRNLAAWRPRNATSGDVVATVLAVLQSSLRLLETVLYVTQRARLTLSSIDPLVDPGKVRDVLVSISKHHGLLPPEEDFAVTRRDGGWSAGGSGEGDSNDGNPVAPEAHGPTGIRHTPPALDIQTHPPLLLPAIGGVVRLLQLLHGVYHDSGARRAALRVVQTLFARFRVGMAQQIFSLLASSSRYVTRYPSLNRAGSSTEGSPAFACAAEGRLLEEFIHSVSDRTRMDMPYSVPDLQCAMLRAVFYILPHCETDVAERLGRFSFQFLSDATAYVVRRRTAAQVHVLFRLFSARSEFVLRELLVRCREGILSSNVLWCATSLLALAEAACAAPSLEVPVVYVLLECWATRGIYFRASLLECLQRIAVHGNTSDGQLHEEEFAASQLLRAPEDEGATSQPPPRSALAVNRGYARLCLAHARPLIFSWLWTYRHPFQALPVECFGYSRVEDLLAAHLPIFACVGLLLSVPLPSSHGVDREDARALLTPCPLMQAVVNVYATQIAQPPSQQQHHRGATATNDATDADRESGSSSSLQSFAAASRDAAHLLLPLLSVLPQVVAQLAVLAVLDGSPHDRRRATGRRREREMSDDTSSDRSLATTAAAAMYWLEHTLLGLEDGVREGVVRTALGPAAAADLMKHESEYANRSSPGAPAPALFSVLLDSCTDAVLVALLDLHGAELPHVSAARLRTAAEALAGRRVTAAAPEVGQKRGRESHSLLSAARTPLETVFLCYDGAIAATVVQHLYAAVVQPASSSRRGRRMQALALLEDVCTRWFTAAVVCCPHVLRTVVAVCTHLLYASPRYHARVGSILLHVWPVAAATAPTVTATVSTSLSVAMLALAADSTTVMGTWRALCRSDASLKEKDWQLLSTQYVASEMHSGAPGAAASTVAVDVDAGDRGEDDAEVDAGEALAEARRATDARQQEVKLSRLLPLLQNVVNVAGPPSSSYFRALADAVERERSTLAACLRDVQKASTSTATAAAAARVSHAPSPLLMRHVVQALRQAIAALFLIVMPSGEIGSLAVSTTAPIGLSPVSVRPSHHHSSVLAALNLLRALSWCFIEAGLASSLMHLGRHAPAAPAAVCAASSAVYVGHLLGQGYARQLAQLYAWSFHVHPHVAALAAETLRGWLAERTAVSSPGALTADAALLALARQHLDAGAEDDEGGAGEDQLGELSQVTPSRMTESRSDDEEAAGHVELDAMGADASKATQGIQTALLRPFERQVRVPWRAVPFSSRVDDDTSVRGLLDPRLWEVLTVSSDEFAFIPQFCIAVGHTYDLAQRSHVLGAAFPLLQYEVTQGRRGCSSSGSQSDNDTAASDGPTESFSEALLPLLLLHVMLLRETEGRRHLRLQWSTLLHTHVVQRADRFPRTARLLLRTLHLCHTVLMTGVRDGGLRAFKAPRAGPSSGVPAGEADESPHVTRDAPTTAPPMLASLSAAAVGTVPTLQHMRECYWLEDVPALDLARAAVAVGEPYLAAFFIEISGESTLRAEGGLPVAAEFNEPHVQYSVLFPQASRPPRGGMGAGGARAPATTASRGARLREKEEVRRTLVKRYRDTVARLYEQVRVLTLSEPAASGEASPGAHRHTERDGAIDHCSGYADEDSWQALLSRAEDARAGVLPHDNPKAFANGEANAAAATVHTAQVFIKNGLPHTAVQVILGAAEVTPCGLAGGSVYPSHHHGSPPADMRATLAEAAWRCQRWYVTEELASADVTRAGDALDCRVLEYLQRDRVVNPLEMLPSYHEAVLFALRALHRGHTTELTRCVREAQLAVYRQLHPLRWFSSMLAMEALQDLRACGEARDADVLHHHPPPRWIPSADAPSLALPAGVRYSQWELLDSVRHAICQLQRHTDWWQRFVCVSCSRALHGHAAPVAHSRLRSLRQWLELQWRAEGGDDTSGGVNAALARLPAEARVELTLLQARTSYALGQYREAVRALQAEPPAADAEASALLVTDMEGVARWMRTAEEEDGKEPHTSLSFTLPASGATVPRVVQQMVPWFKRLQLVPPSQLVRDPFLSRCAASDGSGACSLELASLCHALAKDIANRLRSYEYQQLRQSMEDSKAALRALERQSEAGDLHEAASRLVRQRLRLLKVDVAREEEEWQSALANYALYRRSAINSYARYLQLTGPEPPENTFAVFGLVELWLQADATLAETSEQAPGRTSRGTSTASVTDDVLRKALQNTPTYKFLPLFAQLAAQLGSGPEEERLAALVLRVARAHPLQTVWPLLALALGHQFGGSSEVNAMHDVDTTKVAAAQHIVQTLKRTAEPAETAQIVQQADRLSAAYVELALHKVNANSGRTHRIPRDFKLLEDIHSLDIPPPTVAWALDAPAEPPSVLQYEAIFTTPGGVNVPKVLRCVLSNGQVVRQLLKSNDDLRQDALIEQVFGLANTFFEQDIQAHGQRVYTYNVVPLAPTVGVLEWVDQTIPLGEYLAGSFGAHGDSPGAHERYFPGELTTRQCREKLREAPKHLRCSTLLEIYGAFTPALHYFFLERFFSVSEWLERRQTYTRSVATSSMVGYIVGLGDRHGSNLLLHQRSADLVHIDLGIAFDQNKLLPIPELVPFRLTRNLVDGLGVRGVEGDFLHRCNVALRVLRERRAFMMTILEAFVHDPLARWSLAAHAGEDDADVEDGLDGEGSKRAGRTPRHRRPTPADAQRTLARVAAKLNGYDGGEQLSVPTQVQKLVQAAQNVENLSAMFVGWSPWL